MKWKKNFLKIPKETQEKIFKMKGNYFKVVCIKSIPKMDIVNKLYDHISIRYEDGYLLYHEKIVPSISNGIYSRYNHVGRIIPRDDLPKVIKCYSFDRPNFGDYSKGTHEISYSKEVKQKEIWLPELISIKIELLEEADNLIFKFEVDDIIDRSIEGYVKSVMFNINLLQENCGAYDVHEVDVTNDELRNTLYVNWELLPPGSNEIERFISGMKENVSSEQYERIEDRYEFIKSLDPIEIIKGTNKFSKYFGARFNDNLVILENIDYGNAIYIFHDDWDILSKLSRTELLRMKTDKLTRIVHSRDWKKSVIACIGYGAWHLI